MLRNIFLVVSLALLGYGCGNPSIEPAYQIYLGPTAILPTSFPTTVPTPTGTLVMADAWTPTPIPSATPLPDEVLAIVIDVVDGDTLNVILEGDSLDRIYTVDLIGVSVPENNDTEPWGIVAADQMNHWLRGKGVRLVRDNTLVSDEGILPRYLYAGNEFINLRLVSLGLARVAFSNTDRLFEADFQTAEQEARSSRRGLWGPNPTPTVRLVATATITSSETQQ